MSSVPFLVYGFKVVSRDALTSVLIFLSESFGSSVPPRVSFFSLLFFYSLKLAISAVTVDGTPKTTVSMYINTTQGFPKCFQNFQIQHVLIQVA